MRLSASLLLAVALVFVTATLPACSDQPPPADVPTDPTDIQQPNPVAE